MCKDIFIYLAFQCIAKGQTMNIPEYITCSYVKNAEEVVNMSYSYSETFSLVSKQ